MTCCWIIGTARTQNRDATSFQSYGVTWGAHIFIKFTVYIYQIKFEALFCFVCLFVFVLRGV